MQKESGTLVFLWNWSQNIRQLVKWSANNIYKSKKVDQVPNILFLCFLLILIICNESFGQDFKVMKKWKRNIGSISLPLFLSLSLSLSPSFWNAVELTSHLRLIVFLFGNIFSSQWSGAKKWFICENKRDLCKICAYWILKFLEKSKQLSVLVCCTTAN